MRSWFFVFLGLAACVGPDGGKDADADGDGYPAERDCDDDDASIHPGAAELCDAADLDEDCDGRADDADDAPGNPHDWYPDADGDGFGGGTPTSACDLPADHVDDHTDCDDANADAHPGAAEVCDGADNDCDGGADDADPDGPPAVTTYADADGDGYGDPATGAGGCGVGRVGNDMDCDDGDASVHPAGAEICDGAAVDEDCDGLVDDADDSMDRSTLPTVYADLDEDGYGDPDAAYTACDPGVPTAARVGDCDDGDDGVHEGLDEVCQDAKDNDCDGTSNDCARTGRHRVHDIDLLKIRGAESGDVGGEDLRFVGDLDGDGRDELVAGSGRGTDGGAWLFEGPLTGAGRTSDLAAQAFEGDGSGLDYGYRIDAADYDGDGAPDLALSDEGYGYSSSGSSEGRIYVYAGPLSHGRDLGPRDADATITSSERVGIGAYLAHGDNDGDGVEDLYVTTNILYTYILPGPLAAGETAIEDGYAIYGMWETTTVVPGDLDGDGFDDVVAGAPGEEDGDGMVRVVFGPVTADADVDDLGAVELDTVSGGLGGALEVVDLDGDGYEDVLASARLASSGAGKVYLIRGTATRASLFTSGSSVFTGNTSGQGFGVSLCTGDVDGDGHPDLAIGGWGADDAADDAGAVGLFYGPTFASAT
ncbi:MAG: MopE-related protein, partial [Myxococcota bacterium]